MRNTRMGIRCIIWRSLTAGRIIWNRHRARSGTERARVAKVYVDAADREAPAGSGQGQQGAAQPQDGQPQDGQPQDGQPQGDPNQPQ